MENKVVITGIGAITPIGSNCSEFLASLKSGKNGINAMSISDLTGIPRPTVLRKLRRLMKLKLIIKDNKSLYKLNQNSKLLKTEVDAIRQQNAKKLSILLAKFYNFVDC